MISNKSVKNKISLSINEISLIKISKIAKYENRSVSNKVSILLNEYIETYENNHGEIDISSKEQLNKKN